MSNITISGGFWDTFTITLVVIIGGSILFAAILAYIFKE